MFTKLHKDAKLPTYAHPNDACADIFSSFQQSVAANSIQKLHTGIKCEIPNGWELQIRPKSGLASSGLIAIFGTIDSDYQSEILVLMQNTRNGNMIFYPGTKIAQISLQTVYKIQGCENNQEELRTFGGFGSSGI